MADASGTMGAGVRAAAHQQTDALRSAIRDQGGARFDPAGWHYLEALSRRAEAQEGSVRHLLHTRLAKATAAFSERFTKARSDAAALLDSACRDHPQAAAQLQLLFDGGHFRGLQHLHASLQARAQHAPLAALAACLDSSARGPLAHAPAAPASSGALADGHAHLDLKTVRESRATWARLSVVRELSLAMRQAPKNAGPINSHMLVLRALAMMQEASPDYLSNMVSYIDTLLSLDPGEKEVPVKRRKATPSKATRPAKATKK